jgi:hypothetical protein
MADYVCSNAMLKCSFGLTPSVFTVLPDKKVMIGGMPAANIMDFKPMVNIKPFGMCQSLANPTVASATAAAMGALTPMPCIPNTVTPWVPGMPTTLISNQPALTNECKLNCIWGGIIEISTAGQMTVKT